MIQRSAVRNVLALGLAWLAYALVYLVLLGLVFGVPLLLGIAFLRIVLL